MSRKLLYSFALFYPALPTVIFLLSWTNLFIGIPLALGIVGVGCTLCSKFKGYTPISSPGTVLAILLCVAVWITVAGVGGFMWQNEWDHDFRNALFIDLYRNAWPVVSGDEMLVYYLGFWLPAAGIAKIFGSLTLGWIIQWVWAWLGIITALWILFDYVGKIKFSVIVILIFAGSIDIIPALVRNVDDMRSGLLPFLNAVIENWGGIGFIEWPDVMIFWVYNQFVPSFLGCMLIFRCNDARITIFTMAMWLLTAPFSEFLIALIAAYQLIVLISSQRGLSQRLKAVFSSTNILALLILAVIGTYMTSNSASGTAHLNTELLTPGPDRAFYWKLLGCLLLFSILPWLIVSFRRLRSEPAFYLLFIGYLPCMFIVMGDGQDFLSRTVLPLLFFIFVKLAQTLTDYNPKRKPAPRLWRVAFIICLALSSVTPLLDMTRSAYYTSTLPREEWRRHGYESIFNTERAHENFTGPQDKWIFSRTYHSASPKLDGI
ncbi:MAG: hypothetical protein K2M03_07360 [Muribaculaceae bacterium]|nr:hypothetical protein [Muribaculaceae bacterium]